MALWFSCKIRYMIQDENGKQSSVSEQYLVDALSFTEAEARLVSELSSTVRDYTLTNITRMNLADIFHFDDAETWYKCKVVYVTVDEETGKEIKTKNVMLVSAHNPKQAYERIEESLATMIVPYNITDINVTSILDIFPYRPMEEKMPDALAALHSEDAFEQE